MHGHNHVAPASSRTFAIGIGLNVLFVIVEIAYGIRAHSLALLSDAGHNLGDVLGLGLSWGAVILAQRPPSERHTYGMRRASILASLGNAILLLVAVGGISGRHCSGWPAHTRSRGEQWWWSRRSASSSTGWPHFCSCPGGTMTSTSAAPSSICCRMPPYRSVSFSPESPSN